MTHHPTDHRFTDFLSEQQQIEARARALQGEATARFFTRLAEAIRKAFRHSAAGHTSEERKPGIRPGLFLFQAALPSGRSLKWPAR